MFSTEHIGYGKAKHITSENEINGDDLRIIYVDVTNAYCQSTETPDQPCVVTVVVLVLLVVQQYVQLGSWLPFSNYS